MLIISLQRVPGLNRYFCVLLRQIEVILILGYWKSEINWEISVGLLFVSVSPNDVALLEHSIFSASKQRSLSSCGFFFLMK